MTIATVWILLLFTGPGRITVLPGQYVSTNDCEAAFEEMKFSAAGAPFHRCVRTPYPRIVLNQTDPEFMK